MSANEWARERVCVQSIVGILVDEICVWFPCFATVNTLKIDEILPTISYVSLRDGLFFVRKNCAVVRMLRSHEHTTAETMSTNSQWFSIHIGTQYTYSASHQICTVAVQCSVLVYLYISVSFRLPYDPTFISNACRHSINWSDIFLGTQREHSQYTLFSSSSLYIVCIIVVPLYLDGFVLNILGGWKWAQHTQIWW